MDMEFGMPALIELSGLEENARLCNTLGLKFIELNMNLPEYQIECLKNRKAFQDISHKYGVYYTVHLDENLNISDFNPGVTMAYSDTVKQVIEIAKELKTPLLNMHMNEGVYFTLPDRKIFLLEKYEDIYLKNILDFRNRCEEWVGTDDIVIAIENTGGYFDFQKKAVNDTRSRKSLQNSFPTLPRSSCLPFIIIWRKWKQTAFFPQTGKSQGADRKRPSMQLRIKESWHLKT